MPRRGVNVYASRVIAPDTDVWQPVYARSAEQLLHETGASHGAAQEPLND